MLPLFSNIFDLGYRSKHSVYIWFKTSVGGEILLFRRRTLDEADISKYKDPSLTL